MNKFVVGSRAFFTGLSGFTPHDSDVLLLEDNPDGYKVYSQIKLRGNCYFKWRRVSADRFISETLKSGCSMFIGKFLVPDFANEIGLTIDKLKLLRPLIDSLDDRHKYEKVIFEAYIENNSFFLTNEQLMKAFEIYKESRK